MDKIQIFAAQVDANNPIFNCQLIKMIKNAHDLSGNLIGILFVFSKYNQPSSTMTPSSSCPTTTTTRPNCEMTRELTEAILAEVPEAEVEAVEGDEGGEGNV